MSTFKNYYLEEKEEKELQEAYTQHLIDNGYVLNDDELDYENAVEEDVECEDCCYTDIDVMDDGDLNERLFKKIVVRGGKKVKKWFTTDKNKRVQPDPGGGKPKEVVKKAKEKIARKKGALKGKIKRKTKAAQSKIKRRLSKLKRSIFGLK